MAEVQATIGGNRTSERPPVLSTLLLMVLHALAWLGLLGYLLLRVPRHKKVFAELAMRLPWMTETLIDISDFVADNWFMLLPGVFSLLIADGVVLFLLRWGRQSIWSWLWFLLFFSLPLLGFTLALWAIQMPS
jgi:type II secretory pathway component PulF